MPPIVRTIQKLQEEHLRWVEHNFPDQRDHEPLLGIVEEVGELAHAHLKMQQGIRGVDVEKAEDALGDIFIYMMSYANANGYNLQHCILQAWDEVKERDWIANPLTGVKDA